MNQPPSPPEPGAGLTFSSVMDLLLDAICVVDVQGRYLFVSAAFEHIFGYAPEEVIGRPMIGLVHPDDRERTLQAADEIMAGQPKPHFQNRYVRKDGRVIHIMWSARWSETDRVRIAVARDVTELKHAERMQAALHAISEAAHSAEDLLELFRHIHRIVGELLPANNFFVALYDADKDELSFPYFVDEHDPPPPTQSLDSGTLSNEVIRSGQALLLTPEARMELPPRVRPIVGRDSLEWLGVPLGGPQGVIGALVVQSYSGELRYNEQDKTLLQFVSTQIAAAIERKKSTTRLQYLAQHDQLTSLPNRGLFHDRLRTALARTRRDRQQLAVLYLDLDRFKPVNDHHGHDVGDLLLREVAARIRHCVRESDTVGRIGGDEFVVLLNDAGHADHAVAVAAKIGAALRQPFELAGGRLQVSASIGIALYPAHGEDARQLLRRADDAMYDAKRQGGDQARISGTP
ncbi:sensor domain-containing protein [Rhodanobacter denitrificans]|uniref:PAS domain S-box/diguanylate cyclase (GGDEF) domain-containing protein n=1 Tax=Rhodanobacter denitrificans TaxID=666685 RepID=M4NPI6_9GAMM|nr:GGDEF domain-containing protein [Rhodanobacter denitrificans]AGG89561.1 PAS domain S-box/diguanylate cyclase (GGDEF) domain-containing protein [Rhodanobacter denitrificans]UJM88440.1 diguanylate cyclase [Rhodanobacter denitrificans]